MNQFNLTEISKGSVSHKPMRKPIPHGTYGEASISVAKGIHLCPFRNSKQSQYPSFTVILTCAVADTVIAL